MEDNELTSHEIADQAIDFIESIGLALLPWQAMALRAMLTYPVPPRFTITAQRQHPQRGFVSDNVTIDEYTTERDGLVAPRLDEPEDDPPKWGWSKVIR